MSIGSTCAHSVFDALYAAGLSPRLATRSEFHIEGPCAPVLMGDVPHFLRNGSRCDEKVIGCIRPPFACPLQVDDRIYHYIGDMYTLWSEFTSHCFRENSLCRLGRCKPCKIRF